MGNICRSPMAERLLALAAREVVGDKADDLIHSHSAGTGGWHAGEEMNPPAARVAATDHAGVGAMLVMWIWAAMAGPNVRPEERDGRVSRTS
jgi:hypothetical protein